MQIPETNESPSEDKRRAALRERLIAGYQANAEADALLAEEWRPIDEEGWAKIPPFIKSNKKRR